MTSDRLRSSPAARAAALAAALCLLTGFGLAGCAGSSQSDDAATQARIDRERADAAETARNEQKLADLQEEVRALKKRESTRRKTAAARAPVPSASASRSSGDLESRTFHVPSGNVSCRISSRAATCTVAVIEKTFSFADGGTAGIEPGVELPRASGSAVGWGTTVSVGAVTCSVPPQTARKGITCTDVSTGHGFEASRQPSRRKAY